MSDSRMSTSNVKISTEKELVIERIIDAPRERVWNAWTKPELVMKWWGPQYFTSPEARIDLRVGGKYLFCMRSPEGQDFWSGGVYREIVENKRIVYTDSFMDAEGNVLSGESYGMGADFPKELVVTVTFEDYGPGKTRITLTHAGLPEGEMREMTGSGWSTSFDKLAESVK